MKLLGGDITISAKYLVTTIARLHATILATEIS